MKKINSAPNFVIEGALFNLTGLTIYVRLDEEANNRLVITVGLRELPKKPATFSNDPYLPEEGFMFSIALNQPTDEDVYHSYQIKLVNPNSLKLVKDSDTIDEEKRCQDIVYLIKLLQ